MSLVDVDSWSTEYEACERLNHTILTKLIQREKRQRVSPEYNRLTATILIELNQFETELQQLKKRLEGFVSSRSLTFEEVERRQRQVDTLNSQLQELQRKYTNTTRADRSALLDEGSTNKQSPWQTATMSSSTSKPNNSDVQAVKRTQSDILEEQNRGLETLSQTISRQRALATQLGQEVDDQNEILDNLANTMERVDTSVNVETEHIGQINRQDSTWGYWIVIVVLLVAIVVVAFV